MADRIEKTEEEWRALLTPQQFDIGRLKGTERAFTGRYWNSQEPGTYLCAACKTPLFRSSEKFDSGCGWPSYFAPASPGAVVEHDDTTHGMRRTEVTCAACDAHLGHVFHDGPPPTGLRYCINSGIIEWVPPE